MSGVRLVQRGPQENVQECILANSTYLDFEDFVSINSSGFLARTAAGNKIDGYFVGSSNGLSTTSTSDNQTVAVVKGRYVPVTPAMIFEMTSDQACTQTDLGAYADVALSTNAFLCDLAAGSSGQLYLTDFDPDRDGSTTKVRVCVAERSQDAYAQA